MLTQRVLISSKVKRVYLQRFLVSKFSFYKEQVDIRDLCCLFENQLWLENKCQLEDDFNRKFGKSLEVLSKILKEINFKIGITNRAIDRLSIRLQNDLNEFVLPKRNYKDAFIKCNGHFQLKEPKSQGVPNNRIPPKAYIGKGYRDKGSAKNLSKDGSPSWQEVATHRGPLYHKGRKYEELQDSRTAQTRVGKILERINKE
jgi:hypothetical protein